MTLKTNCTIYLGHTSLSSFASVADFVPPDLLQAVYVGSFNCIKGWNRIFLDTPFAYNGTDNLVMAVDDNSGALHTGFYSFDAVNIDYPMTLSFSSNADDVTPSIWSSRAG